VDSRARFGGCKKLSNASRLLFPLAFVIGRLFTRCNVQLKRTHRSRPGQSLVALLLSALVLLSSLMAVSPALHQLLHQDAKQTSHHCVVTLMQKQHVCTASPAPLLLGLGLASISFFPLTEAPAPSQFNYAPAPSRAPPASLR
jgi:hypothetical protein